MFFFKNTVRQKFKTFVKVSFISWNFTFKWRTIPGQPKLWEVPKPHLYINVLVPHRRLSLLKKNHPHLIYKVFLTPANRSLQWFHACWLGAPSLDYKCNAWFGSINFTFQKSSEIQWVKQELGEKLGAYLQLCHLLVVWSGQLTEPCCNFIFLSVKWGQWYLSTLVISTW